MLVLAFLLLSYTSAPSLSLVGTNTLLHIMITNIITISTYCPQYQAFIERDLWINRRRRLSYRGAQRIISKSHPGSIVTRIDTVIYA